MKPTIKLKRSPSRRDYDLISLAAQQECVCTDQMKQLVKEGNAKTDLCAGCAARLIHNEIVSLAKVLSS